MTEECLFTYAHSTNNSLQNDWEKLVDHLENVAAAAQRNALGFGAEYWAHSAGLLHDLGKKKPGFQAYLRGERGSDPHSGEGARYACDHLGARGKLLAYCIAGHHAGLPNGVGHSAAKPPTPLDERLRQADVLTLPDGINVPDLTPIPTALATVSNENSTTNFALHFFTRMLFRHWSMPIFWKQSGFMTGLKGAKARAAGADLWMNLAIV